MKHHHQSEMTATMSFQDRPRAPWRDRNMKPEAMVNKLGVWPRSTPKWSKRKRTKAGMAGDYALGSLIIIKCLMRLLNFLSGLSAYLVIILPTALQTSCLTDSPPPFPLILVFF